MPPEPADAATTLPIKEAIAHLRAAILLLDQAGESGAAIYACQALETLGVPGLLPADYPSSD